MSVSCRRDCLSEIGVGGGGFPNGDPRSRPFSDASCTSWLGGVRVRPFVKVVNGGAAGSGIEAAREKPAFGRPPAKGV
eukprot:SAG31_NODE_46227_length_255_cov_0.865385_1_plen_77_part_01